MFRLAIVPLLLFVLVNLCASSPKILDNRTFKNLAEVAKSQPSTLKLMTFNTWLLGKQVNEGLDKIAKHIKIVDPDIVGIQEVTGADRFYELAAKMGPEWSYAYVNGSNCAILSKHPMIPDETYAVTTGVGATIMIDSKIPIHAYSMHLAYKSYGPYAANNKKVTEERQLDAGEYFPDHSRYNNIKSLISDKVFQKWMKVAYNSIPLIVLGDFNCPSHLDWTEATKAEHGGWVYRWPATFLLETKTKLVDTFREVHPDPVKVPGNSWSTVWVNVTEWNYTVPEPQDRIDFIYYRSSQLKTIDSQLYAGDFTPYPGDVKNNDWPSDHYSVVSKLEWINKNFGNKDDKN